MIVPREEDDRKAGIAFEAAAWCRTGGVRALVLEATYDFSNEGYAAMAADDLVRPGLCLRRNGLAADGWLMPRMPKVPGLVGPDGNPGVAPGEGGALGWMGAFMSSRSRTSATWQRSPRRAGASTRRPAPKRLAAPRVADVPQAVLCCLLMLCAPGSLIRTGSAFAGARRPAAVVVPSPVVDLTRVIAHSTAFGPEAGLRPVGRDCRRRRPARRTRHCWRRGVIFLSRAGSTGRGGSRIEGCGQAGLQRVRKDFPRTSDACDCKH